METGVLRVSPESSPCVNLRSLVRALEYVEWRKATGATSAPSLFVDGLVSFAGSNLGLEGKQQIYTMARALNFPVTPPAAASELPSPDQLRLSCDVWLPLLRSSVVWHQNTATIEGFSLPRGPIKDIDLEAAHTKFFCTKSVRRLVTDLVRLLSGSKSPVLLEGPTSSGKSSMVEFLAALTCHRFVRINNHEQITLAEYLGQYVANSRGSFDFREGPLLRAVRNGDWVVLDEFNLAPSEVIEGLNRLLDDNREVFVPELNEIVKAHPHFLLFATQNPVSYGGRKPLSEALKSRFVEFFVAEPPAAELKLILMASCGIPPETAEGMVAVFEDIKIHRLETQQTFEILVTIRDLLRWGKCLAHERSPIRSAFFVIGERLRSTAARETFKQFLMQKLSKPSSLKSNLECSEIYKPISSLLPTGWEEHSDLTATATMTRLVNVLTWCWTQDEPCLLIGATGCGKTAAVQLVAQSMAADKPLISISCQQNTDVSDFIGSFKPLGKNYDIIRLLDIVILNFEHFAKLKPPADAEGPAATESMSSPNRSKLTLSGNEILSDLIRDETAPQNLSRDETPSPNLVVGDLAALKDAASQLKTKRLPKQDLKRLQDVIGRLRRLVESVVKVDDAASLEPAKKRKKLEILEKADLLRALDSIAEELPSCYRLFEWQDGPLLRAMKEGRPLLVDEINLADDAIVERLNSVLESGRSFTVPELAGKNEEGVIRASPGFRFFATMNPGGDYGKRELSKALRNRFFEVFIPQMSFEDEDCCAIVRQRLHEPLMAMAGDTTSTLATATVVDMMRWLEVHCVEAISLRSMISWIQSFWAFVRISFVNQTEVPQNKERHILHALLHGFCVSFLDGFDACYHLKETAAALTPEENGILEGLPPAKRLDLHTHHKSRVLLHLLALILDGLCEARDENDLHSLAICSGILAAFWPDGLQWVEGQPEWMENRFVLSPFSIAAGKTATVPTLVFSAPTTLQNTARVIRALQTSQPLLLEGSPGAGKTALVVELAMSTSRSLFRVNLSEQSELSDLTGSFVPRGDGFEWEAGPLVKALSGGHWILLDEINLAPQPVLEGLNSLLDHRAEIFLPDTGETLRPVAGFRLFAAQNRCISGGGRKGLPRSFLSRFITIDIQALRDEDFTRILPTFMPAEAPAPLVDKFTELSRLPYRHAAAFDWEWNVRDLQKIAAVRRQLENFLGEDKKAACDGRLSELMETTLQIALGARLSGSDRCLFLEALGVTERETRLLGLSPSVARELVAQVYEADLDDYPPEHLLPMVAIRQAALVDWPVLISSSPHGDGVSLLSSLAATLKKLLVTITVGPTTDGLELLGAYGKSARVEAGVKWIDGVLIQAVRAGDWVLIDNAHAAAPGVLDRLNSLLEPQGALTITEAGEFRLIPRHPGFRIFINTHYEHSTGISQALRNRCLEVHIPVAGSILTFGLTRESTGFFHANLPIRMSEASSPVDSFRESFDDVVVPSVLALEDCFALQLDPAIVRIMRCIVSPGYFVSAARFLAVHESHDEGLWFFHCAFTWITSCLCTLSACVGIVPATSSLSYQIVSHEDWPQALCAHGSWLKSLLEETQKSQVRQQLELGWVPSVFDFSDLLRFSHNVDNLNCLDLKAPVVSRVIVTSCYLHRYIEVSRFVGPSLVTRLCSNLLRHTQHWVSVPGLRHRISGGVAWSVLNADSLLEKIQLRLATATWPTSVPEAVGLQCLFSNYSDLQRAISLEENRDEKLQRFLLVASNTLSDHSGWGSNPLLRQRLLHSGRIYYSASHVSLGTCMDILGQRRWESLADWLESLLECIHVDALRTALHSEWKQSPKREALCEAQIRLLDLIYFRLNFPAPSHCSATSSRSHDWIVSLVEKRDPTLTDWLRLSLDMLVPYIQDYAALVVDPEVSCKLRSLLCLQNLSVLWKTRFSLPRDLLAPKISRPPQIQLTVFLFRVWELRHTNHNAVDVHLISGSVPLTAQTPLLAVAMSRSLQTNLQDHIVSVLFSSQAASLDSISCLVDCLALCQVDSELQADTVAQLFEKWAASGGHLTQVNPDKDNLDAKVWQKCLSESHKFTTLKFVLYLVSLWNSLSVASSHFAELVQKETVFVLQWIQTESTRVARCRQLVNGLHSSLPLDAEESRDSLRPILWCLIELAMLLRNLQWNLSVDLSLNPLLRRFQMYVGNTLRSLCASYANFEFLGFSCMPQDINRSHRSFLEEGLRVARRYLPLSQICVEAPLLPSIHELDFDTDALQLCLLRNILEFSQRSGLTCKSEISTDSLERLTKEVLRTALSIWSCVEVQVGRLCVDVTGNSLCIPFGAQLKSTLRNPKSRSFVHVVSLSLLPVAWVELLRLGEALAESLMAAQNQTLDNLAALRHSFDNAVRNLWRNFSLRDGFSTVDFPQLDQISPFQPTVCLLPPEIQSSLPVTKETEPLCEDLYGRFGQAQQVFAHLVVMLKLRTEIASDLKQEHQSDWDLRLDKTFDYTKFSLEYDTLFEPLQTVASLGAVTQLVETACPRVSHKWQLQQFLPTSQNLAQMQPSLLSGTYSKDTCIHFFVAWYQVTRSWCASGVYSNLQEQFNWTQFSIYDLLSQEISGLSKKTEEEAAEAELGWIAKPEKSVDWGNAVDEEEARRLAPLIKELFSDGAIAAAHRQSGRPEELSLKDRSKFLASILQSLAISVADECRVCLREAICESLTLSISLAEKSIGGNDCDSPGTLNLLLSSLLQWRAAALTDDSAHTCTQANQLLWGAIPMSEHPPKFHTGQCISMLKEVHQPLINIKAKLVTVGREFSEAPVEKYVAMVDDLLQKPALSLTPATLLKILEKLYEEVEFWNRTTARSQDKVGSELQLLSSIIIRLRRQEVGDWNNILRRRQIRWGEEYFQTGGLRIIQQVIWSDEHKWRAPTIFSYLEKETGKIRIVEFPLMKNLLRAVCDMLESRETPFHPVRQVILNWLKWADRYDAAICQALNETVPLLDQSISRLQQLTEVQGKSIERDRRNLENRQIQVAREVEKFDALCRSTVTYVFAQVRATQMSLPDAPSVSENEAVTGDDEEAAFSGCELAEVSLLDAALELARDLTIEASPESTSRTYTELKHSLQAIVGSEQGVGYWVPGAVESELLERLSGCPHLNDRVVKVIDETMMLLALSSEDMNQDYWGRIKYDLHILVSRLVINAIDIFAANHRVLNALAGAESMLAKGASSVELFLIPRQFMREALTCIDDTLLLVEIEFVTAGPPKGTFLSDKATSSEGKRRLLEDLRGVLRKLRGKLACRKILTTEEYSATQKDLQKFKDLCALLSAHGLDSLQESTAAVLTRPAFMIDDEVENVENVLSLDGAEALERIFDQVKMEQRNLRSDLSALKLSALNAEGLSTNLESILKQQSPRLPQKTVQPSQPSPKLLKALKQATSRLLKVDTKLEYVTTQLVRIIRLLAKEGLRITQKSEGEAKEPQQRFRDQWQKGDGLADGSGITGAEETVEHEHELDTLEEENSGEPKVASETPAESGRTNEVETMADFGGDVENIESNENEPKETDEGKVDENFDEKVEQDFQNVEDNLEGEFDTTNCETTEVDDPAKLQGASIPQVESKAAPNTNDSTIDISSDEEEGEREVEEGEREVEEQPRIQSNVDVDEDLEAISIEDGSSETAEEEQLPTAEQDNTVESPQKEEGEALETEMAETSEDRGPNDAEETPESPPPQKEAAASEMPQKSSEDLSTTADQAAAAKRNDGGKQFVHENNDMQGEAGDGTEGQGEGAALQSLFKGPVGQESSQVEKRHEIERLESALTKRNPMKCIDAQAQRRLLRELLGELNNPETQESETDVVDSAAIDDKAEQIGEAFGSGAAPEQRTAERAEAMQTEEVVTEPERDMIEEEALEIVREPTEKTASLPLHGCDETSSPEKEGAATSEDLDGESIPEQWSALMARASSLCGPLCESLRVVLEPTNRGRYEGYFKSGKRLAIRQVMAFIASDFKRDRIWLRRTKLSKRQYEIVLAIDNSASMRHGRAHEEALGAMMAIALALRQLEAGDLSIMAYGGKAPVELLPFGASLDSRVGEELLAKLQFTDAVSGGFEKAVPSLLDAVAERFESQPNANTSALSKLLIILTDGRFSKQTVTAKLKRLEASRIVPVLIVTSPSIYSVKEYKKEGGKMVASQFLSEDFPFKFYTVLEDASRLQHVLADVVRSYIQRIETIF
eukprot:Gregarina_sp_Poly_1__366@NODE_108_length_14049_cov_12_387284_g95_i0_p1_GENE_NODE_108_length_14049_cov_12_387284_g95_i0NODE_108_length_14049_cov_12_387284_g95_i0_p1_ORF_typecomplete_len4659_score761_60AAA_5/PF07728_14/4_2e10AAA_5/PF07728_14/5_5e13AAA_5/PF07728_14/2_5e35AAA_5/PF07728_14/2_3e09AAA_5/PF07728_14/7_1e22AAA_5/PF07728_14/6_4e32AAA_5/PF07728_14/2_3e14AAA_3/PF07726_11/0_0058AAA_3/PF07726_11/16AAA_3/PF07726_11/5_7e16AAA_3/PF07726_11/0_01AAA_3/PF07726_11/0_0047AAA_3/PF07726_11/4_9e13Dynein_